MGEGTERLLGEREQRVRDALELRKPDRVPIMVSFGFFPAKYAGYTIQDVMYDPVKLGDAQWKTTLEFQPDMEQDPYGLRFLGPVLEMLGYSQLKWPGHGLPADVTYQFVEGEYMKAEEYDHFLLDPSDFIVRTYLPRICEGLRGLAKLPSLHSIIAYYMGLPFGLIPFTFPEVREALRVLQEAAERSLEAAAHSRRFRERAREEGFPLQFGGVTHAPFDALGDFFRGTKGIMLDMYRRPDTLVRACEKFLPLMLENALAGYRVTGNPRIFIPLHKGLDGFMSLDQFKRFFWPTLKDLMLELIREGLVPVPFFEGDCTSRLDVIRDIPAGKAIYKFEATDLAKAKAALRDVACIRGGVPISVLITGTPDEIDQYVRGTLETLACDGGFILDASTGLDDVTSENIGALFTAARRYGG